MIKLRSERKKFAYPPTLKEEPEVLQVEKKKGKAGTTAGQNRRKRKRPTGDEERGHVCI